MSAQRKGKGIDIVNGPSKFDLMASLFITTPSRIPVLFKTKDHGDFTTVITGVRWEDGSGESWIIDGHSAFTDKARFTGWFNTQRRCGHVHFVD